MSQKKMRQTIPLITIIALTICSEGCADSGSKDKSIPVPIDQDEDGVTEGEDCDDTDPEVNTNTEEIPFDGIDNDCDSLFDCEDPDIDLSSEWVGDMFAVDIQGFCDGLCSRRVSGSLTITTDQLTTLAGLECATIIDGDLTISYSPYLTDVTALYGLKRVRGDVFIFFNTALTDEAAQKLVDEIDRIDGAISVSGNG